VVCPRGVLASDHSGNSTAGQPGCGGFAIPSIFVPMTTFSVVTVPKKAMGDATGITSLVRNLGGSVGISLITTFVTRGTQAHQALMVSHLTPHSRFYLERLNKMQVILAPRNGPVTGHSQAYGLVYQLQPRLDVASTPPRLHARRRHCR
jgi:hypothetical protein